MKARYGVGIGIGLILLLVALTALLPAAAQTPTPAAFSSKCFRTAGGDVWVCASGGEMEFQSGATVDVQSGATETHANNPTFSGNPAFSGNPTFSGMPTFSGRPSFTGGVTATVNVQNKLFPTLVSTPITYTAAAGGTGVVATIPDGQIWIVHSVLAHITANFDATGDDATLVVGDGNDADGFLVLSDTELQTTDTEGTGFAAGWQGQADATIGAYLDEVDSGFVYAPSGASETIDWTVDETSGDTLSAGAATIYVWYTRIQ